MKMFYVLVVVTIILIIVFVPFAFWFFPVYGVWAARKAGEAAFAEAQNEQRVILSEANARLEAAEINKNAAIIEAGINKNAAIIEAEAVAAQIDKIGANLKEHDLYLKWQWIKMMEDRHSKSDTIYVPTESGMPILEANRKVK
jgi:hypothetical protein